MTRLGFRSPAFLKKPGFFFGNVAQVPPGPVDRGTPVDRRQDGARAGQRYLVETNVVTASELESRQAAVLESVAKAAEAKAALAEETGRIQNQPV